MEIYLIRHGETDWNKQFRFQGRADIPLNEMGRELARLTSDGLKDIPFETAFCSPLNRAFETARVIIRDRDITLTRDERLMEVSFGIMEGCNFKEAAKDSSDPIHNFLKHPGQYQPPEGAESFVEMYARSAEFMNQVIRPLENQYQTILIVAHGALNRSILNQIAGIPLEDFWNIKLPNCAVSRLELKDGRFRILEECHVYYEQTPDRKNS